MPLCAVTQTLRETTTAATAYRGNKIRDTKVASLRRHMTSSDSRVVFELAGLMLSAVEPRVICTGQQARHSLCMSTLLLVLP